MLKFLNNKICVARLIGFSLFLLLSFILLPYLTLNQCKDSGKIQDVFTEYLLLLQDTLGNTMRKQRQIRYLN